MSPPPDSRKLFIINEVTHERVAMGMRELSRLASSRKEGKDGSALRRLGTFAATSGFTPTPCRLSMIFIVGKEWNLHIWILFFEGAVRWVFFVISVGLLLSSCREAVVATKVSIICPTYNRADRHENLYAAFAHQTYENRELLVLDDSFSASPFFVNLKDPRVKYKHVAQRASIGAKRNSLIEMASGDIIVHFDDDDYYAPEYVAVMVDRLGVADLIKLSRWFAWREIDGSLWEWDTRSLGLFHYVVAGTDKKVTVVDLKEICANDPTFNLANWMDASLWGFGFSYVYRKSLWKECPFEDVSAGEDYRLVKGARELEKILLHTPDFDKIAIHTLHRKSSSKIVPQYHHDSKEAIEALRKQASAWLF